MWRTDDRLIGWAALTGLALFWLSACGGGGGSSGSGGDPRVTVAGTTATYGIFDPSLTESSGTLWMSYSTVNASVNDPVLLTVNTRLASSTDAGQSWTDAGVVPNVTQEFLVSPGPPLPDYWAAWRYEVSRLVYDPHDTDGNRRWKLVWHRYLAAHLPGEAEARRLFEHGWIGYATAATPNGPWTERKLFVGSAYDTANNATIGVPEYNLATLFPGLSGCEVFTEPGLLGSAAATPSANNIYVSLHCAGTTNKIVLLRCTGNFAPNNCTYLGDLLDASEANQFAPVGESYSGFSASELVAAGGRNFLIVSPVSGEYYRGCLVFEIQDLDSAALVRSAGDPVLVRRIGGSAASGFHGACGYTPGATATGLLYGQVNATATQPFQLFESDVHLP
jgi:hypothetical protein